MFQHVVRTGWLNLALGGYTLNRQSSLSVTMHANATLTPLMRAKLIQFHLAHDGSLRASASAFGVSDQFLILFTHCFQQSSFAIDTSSRINLNDRFFPDSQDIFLHGLLANRRAGRFYSLTRGELAFTSPASA